MVHLLYLHTAGGTLSSLGFTGPTSKLFYILLSINQRRRRTSDYTFAGGIIFVRYRVRL
jgi:hypothetical protein